MGQLFVIHFPQTVRILGFTGKSHMQYLHLQVSFLRLWCLNLDIPRLHNFNKTDSYKGTARST